MFQLPYSAGVGLNYFYQKSELVLNNLEVGFNGGQKYNLDNIVRFNEAQAQANAVNFRPDIWLFPFLNVYGVFGQEALGLNFHLLQKVLSIWMR